MVLCTPEKIRGSRSERKRDRRQEEGSAARSGCKDFWRWVEKKNGEIWRLIRWTIVKVNRNRHTASWREKGEKWKRRDEEKRYYNSERCGSTLNDKCLAHSGLWEVHTNKWLPFARGEGHNWERRDEGEKWEGKRERRDEEARGLNPRAVISNNSICIEKIRTFLLV